LGGKENTEDAITISSGVIKNDCGGLEIRFALTAVLDPAAQ
jgi:hypothetical protein